MLSPDSKWDSTEDLRTVDNEFLEDLNENFNQGEISTNYFVIAGTGHYPKPYLSYEEFLPGMMMESFALRVQAWRTRSPSVLC